MDHQLTQSSGQPTGLLGRRSEAELRYVNQVREQSPTDTLIEGNRRIPRGAKEHEKAFLFSKKRNALTSDAPILHNNFRQLLLLFCSFRIRPRFANIMGKVAAYGAKKSKKRN